MPTILHPREVRYSRYWTRRRNRRRFLSPGVQFAIRPRASQPLWSDYYPWAPGTVPEKMVFAVLAEMGVSFFFGSYWGDMPFTEDVYEHYRPDFLLPEYRIVIEIYGTYWHTLGKATERDARKAAMYEAAGYKYYWLWDWEIFANPKEAVTNRIPELVNPAIKTGHIWLSNRPFDPTSSLATQRRKYPKVIRTKFRWSRGIRRQSAKDMFRALYRPHLHGPKRPHPTFGAGFHGLSEEYLQQMRDYATEWHAYVMRLGEFFTKYPTAQTYYPEKYEYWLRWKDWWNRWERAMNTTPEWQEYIASLGSYFARYPAAKRLRLTEYYRWLTWRRMGYRRL